MGVKRSTEFKTCEYDHQETDDKPEFIAKKNKILVKIFDRLSESMIKRAFSSIRVKNKQNYYLRNPDYANILYGFHGCWWDGILAAFLCRKLYNCNLYMMIQDLYRFPALALIGGFSIEKESLSGIRKAINYSIKLLEDPQNSLWIFPQGKLYPLDYRPIKFEGGIAYISKKLKGINLIPIAYTYTFLDYEKPEIFAEIGKPIITENNTDNKNHFLKFLEKDFEKLLNNQKKDIVSGNLTEYEYILLSNLYWTRFLENKLKPLVRIKY